VLAVLLFSALAVGQQTGADKKSAGPVKNEPISGKHFLSPIV